MRGIFKDSFTSKLISFDSLSWLNSHKHTQYSPKAQVQHNYAYISYNKGQVNPPLPPCMELRASMSSERGDIDFPTALQRGKLCLNGKAVSCPSLISNVSIRAVASVGVEKMTVNLE